MRDKIASVNWQSITLCTLISGMFLSFVLETFFVQTLLLWLLGAFAIYTGIRTRKFYFQWYSVFFLALFLLRILALWIQPELKFSNIEQSLSFILFPLIFSLVKVDEKQWKIIQTCVVVGFTLFLILVLRSYYIHIYQQELVRESLTNAKAYYPLFLKSPFYFHPSFLAILLAPSIPMCFNLAVKSEKQWQQWVWLLFIPLLLFIVFVIGSRIGLAVCGALVVLSCLYFFKKLNSFSTLILGVMLGVMLIGSKVSAVDYAKDPIRDAMTNLAVEHIKERPFFGHGYSIQRILFEKQLAESEEFQATLHGTAFDHFHNTYLDELFQFGFIGTLPLFLLILYLIYFCVKKRDIFLFSFLTIYGLFFYVELPFNSIKGIMPMMLFLAVIMNVLYKTNQNQNQPCQ